MHSTKIFVDKRAKAFLSLKNPENLRLSASQFSYWICAGRGKRISGEPKKRNCGVALFMPQEEHF
jgi:hypothetical protein